MIDGIDQRQARIKAELEEARRLREEAQALLAEYQRKRHEADREADAIIATANAEAERLAAEGKAKLEDFVARRTKMAETKIAQAEAQALADVRSSAADAAVAAAERSFPRRRKARKYVTRRGHRRPQERLQLRRLSDRDAADRAGRSPQVPIRSCAYLCHLGRGLCLPRPSEYLAASHLVTETARLTSPEHRRDP